MKSEIMRWRKFFLVWTCIKPNLVLSEISEMKRWRVRWTDEENFFASEHVSSQIWWYLKLVRWRVRWRDEEKIFWVRTCIKPNLVLSEISEMKKKFFGSEHVSSQIWCYLKLVRWRVRWRDEEKFFLVSTCIKPNLVLSEISEMKRWRVRWRDEDNFFWVRTCIKPNLVLSEISEMKRWRVRWRDEQMKKIFLGSKHVSSQIWCYLKLVRWREMNRWRKFFLVWTCIKPNLVLSEISEMKRWRVRWRDEQMKKIFWGVQTCIKPNLVLSEISEMKRWRVRWTDEENFFGSEHVSSQIWCYLKLVRWRDEEWDEEMKRWKNKCFGSEHVSIQIWCQKFFPSWVGGGGSKKVTSKQTNRHTYGHHSD